MQPGHTPQPSPAELLTKSTLLLASRYFYHKNPNLHNSTNYTKLESDFLLEVWSLNSGIPIEELKLTIQSQYDEMVEDGLFDTLEEDVNQAVNAGLTYNESRGYSIAELINILPNVNKDMATHTLCEADILGYLYAQDDNRDFVSEIYFESSTENRIQIPGMKRPPNGDAVTYALSVSTDRVKQWMMLQPHPVWGPHIMNVNSFRFQREVGTIQPTQQEWEHWWNLDSPNRNFWVEGWGNIPVGIILALMGVGVILATPATLVGIFVLGWITLSWGAYMIWVGGMLIAGGRSDQPWDFEIFFYQKDPSNPSALAWNPTPPWTVELPPSGFPFIGPTTLYENSNEGTIENAFLEMCMGYGMKKATTQLQATLQGAIVYRNHKNKYQMDVPSTMSNMTSEKWEFLNKQMEIHNRFVATKSNRKWDDFDTPLNNDHNNQFQLVDTGVLIKDFVSNPSNGINKLSDWSSIYDTKGKSGVRKDRKNLSNADKKKFIYLQ